MKRFLSFAFFFSFPNFIHATSLNVVFEGDSLTYNAASCGSGVNPATWPTKFLNVSTATNFSVITSSADVAFCGETTTQMLSQYASQVQPYKPLTVNDTSYLFLWGGVNDLHASVNTPAQTYDNLKTYWAQARSDGFKVIAFTLMPLFGNESDALTLNNLILSDSSLYDYLIRVDVLFPNYTNTTYFYPDKIHLKTYGSDALGVYAGHYLDLSASPGCDALTTLLLHMDGSNGGVSFPDSSCSGNVKTVSVFGDANTSNAQIKFGTASMAADGTGDYLSIPEHTDFDFSDGDFTVDLWVYPTTVSGVHRILAKDATTNYGWINFAIVNGTLYMSVTSNTSSWTMLDGSTATISANTWTHLAIVRGAEGINAYKMGSAIYSSVTDLSVYSGSEDLKIASENFTPARDFAGYIDELRITTGFSRWLGDFTPPTAAYAPYSSPTPSGAKGSGMSGRFSITGPSRIQ